MSSRLAMARGSPPASGEQLQAEAPAGRRSRPFEARAPAAPGFFQRQAAVARTEGVTGSNRASQAAPASVLAEITRELLGCSPAA
jgi:hypothetical protein